MVSVSEVKARNPL